MAHLLRFVFFGVVVKLLALRLRVRHRERLPMSGPAILVVNPNSPRAVLALMSVLPLRELPKLRPAATLDCFLRSRLRTWFALNIIGIIPVVRKPQPGGDASRNPQTHTLGACVEALAHGGILIFCPQGAHCEDGQRTKFDSCIADLAAPRPEVPAIPVFIKPQSKDRAKVLPFIGDVCVGEAVHWSGERGEFMARLEQAMAALAAEEGEEYTGVLPR